MRGVVLLLIVLFFSPTVWAGYDFNIIKQRVAINDLFEVRDWRPLNDGKSFIAVTDLSGVVLSVGEKNAGIVEALQNMTQSITAMRRCLAIGYLGVSPENAAQRSRLGSVVEDALQSKSTQYIAMNNVKFEVTFVEAGGSIYLSCILTPVE